MGYLIRKNWWIIGLILLLVIILIVAEKQQKEEKAYFDTLETSHPEMLTSSSDSIQAENEYVKTAVYELINISKRVSVFSKYDVNNIPKDATTFKTWGEPVQSELKELQADLSNNLISARYTELFSAPEKFENVNGQAINLLFEVQQDTRALYKAIEAYKLSDVPNLVKKLQEKETLLKRLSNEIVTIANYQPIEKTEQFTVQDSVKNEPTINKAKFDSIKNGMTQEEVEKIIGGPGELVSESGNKGEPLHTVMYAYKGEGDLGANANFLFQGNKLQNKAQFGLK